MNKEPIHRVFEMDLLTVSDDERGEYEKSISFTESINSSMGVSTESIECFDRSHVNQTTLEDERQHAYDIISDCQEGLKYYGLESSEQGSGGVYFIRSTENRMIAVFKPEDEEAFAPNNPKGKTGPFGHQGLRKGIRSGEAARREVAAYFLDRNGFSGVPFTFLAQISDPRLNYICPSVYERGQYSKRGSIQEYIPFDEHIGDLSPQLFTSDQIHRIGILDIMTCNTDRNAENILVQKSINGTYNLIPIDHGYCLPDEIEIGWCDWIWMDWPQARVPFKDDCLRHVESLNIEESALFLRKQLGIREECILNLKIMMLFLKKCVKAGFTLHQMAMIICRDTLDQPSLLEKIVTKARVMSLLSPRLMKKDSFLTPRNSSEANHLRRNSSADDISAIHFYECFFIHLDILIVDTIRRSVEQRKTSRKHQRSTSRHIIPFASSLPLPERTIQSKSEWEAKMKTHLNSSRDPPKRRLSL